MTSGMNVGMCPIHFAAYIARPKETANCFGQKVFSKILSCKWGLWLTNAGRNLNDEVLLVRMMGLGFRVAYKGNTTMSHSRIPATQTASQGFNSTVALGCKKACALLYNPA